MSKFFKGILKQIRPEDEEFAYTCPDESIQLSTLVVGADTPLGKQIAIQLAKEKSKVAVAAINNSTLAGLEGELKSEGAEETLQCTFSVQDVNSIESVVKRVVNKFGKLNLLVLCIEQTVEGGLFSQISNIENLLRVVMEANYLCSMHFAHSALPSLSQENGKIIVLTSGSDNPDNAVFAASQAACQGFFETLQAESSNVNVILMRAENAYPLMFKLDGRTCQTNPSECSEETMREIVSIVSAAAK